MQKESMHFSTSGTVIQDQAVSPESSIKPLECSHCTLAFKSKVYLFEHLNKEHGFAVDAALRGAGLKCAETSEADADDSSNGLGGSFECQQCNFKACSLDYLNQHVKICQKNLCNSEIPETKKAVITKQHKEAAAAKDIPTVPSVMSTSKTKCPLNSSKDLKTYKRPLETITKYFKPSSASKGKPPVQLAESSLPFDSTKETLILRESPSSSSPNSSGVFKVTAKPTIDLTNYSVHPHRSLLVDHLQILDLRSPNNSTTADDIDTRTNNEMQSGPLAKKAKLDKAKTDNSDKANTSKPQSLSSRELSFEFSEDDEEKNVDLVNGDAESSNIFICKHCDHSNESFRKLASHYQNSHPYVRYNIVYIKDPSDESATFRCLDCPVEFPSEADLKRHYSEKHPEAPDVFTMPARELNLVFKCFECPFTIGTSKNLESHYEEKHPEHKVESHLMYCRFSASTHQEEPLQLNTCEKEPNPEEPGGVSPESACSLYEEVKTPTNPPTGEGADVALYYCRNCEFSHKSVVVLHVHYQKSHPGEAVTIDKIKLSCSRVMSQTPWTNESPNLLTMTEKPPPQMNALDYSTRGDVEQSPKKKIILTLRKPKATQEASETHSESLKMKKVESAEDLSTEKRTPTKSNGEMSLETHSLSNNSPDKLYNCQYCSYSSNNLRSVVAHQNNKHVVHGFTSFQDVIQYNDEMQKNKLPNEAKDSACTTAPNSKTSLQVEVSSEKELQHEVDNKSDASQMGVNAFARGENLFFCQTCNYGNPTVKGVYTHQSKSHSKVGNTKERIIDYTALLRDKIKKFTTQAKELPFCTNLPLPLINKGDEYLFFCHFCNYRQRTAEKVVQHSIRRHRRFTVNTQQVCQYTAMVLKDKQKSHPKTTANQKVSHASLWEKVKKKKKTTKKLCKVSASPPMRDSQTQRTLQCHRCEYNTQYVYLLRRHFWKSHKSNRCTAEVLKMCYQQGFVQAGYHCDLCVFSHKEASAVHEHFQKKHPGRNPSLEYVTNRLHVSPDTSSPKKPKKLKIKHTDDSDDNLPSQRSGQNENKTYSCRACSFKGSSFSSLACHYRAVHPWSVKEDGSVLDVIDTTRLSANRDVEENHETPGLFDTYQVPLEVDSSPDSSDEAAVSSVSFNCSYCPARFDTQHGVNIHIGMKHHNDETVDEKEQEQVKLKTRMHVFKCPHCTYVNTKFQGVLTHCQKRHPALAPRADSLHIDMSHLHNSEDCVKHNGPGLRFGGYMCETCPRIFVTQEKLNQHCEMEHNETVPNTLKTAPKTSAKSKTNLSNTVCNQGSISKVSFLSRNMYSLVRCQQCAYSCTTKNALDRHMRVRHKNESVRKVRGPSYNCALCPSSYILKKALGNHYSKKHGQESFLEYYAPLYKTVHRMPAQGSDGNKILVYKCPICSYVNSSHHGVLTHCQMSHPSVVARANELQTDEILKSNMVGCTVGKGSNERGYTCRKCPQMYISMKKLKIHCERDHGKVKAAAPEHSSKIESEKQPDYISDMSVLEAFSLQNKTSALTTKRMLPGHQLGTPEICQSNSLLEQTQDLPYKCKMCAYSGACRKYLHAHYRKLHKLGVLATFNVLGTYNKRKISWAQQPEAEAETENDGPVKCKICQNWFHSSQQLLAHYSTFHSLDRILDFTVLHKASKRSTGLYKCALCQKQMNGIKKLCAHLDRHREMAQIMAKVAKTKASAVVTTTPEAKDIQPCQQDELPILENVEDLAQCNVVPVETFTLPRSPSSPLKPTDVEQPELGSREDNRTCKQCNRTFMSSKGLRTHERSHATMAAIEKLPASVLKHNIDKHVQFKPGTLRPYLCSLCPFRSTVMGLWRSHFLKKHEDVLMDPAETDIQDEESAQRADKEDAAEELNNFPELDEEPEIAERSMYLEPPDVQRQLNHYTLMAQGGASSKANVQDTNVSEKTLLHCEFCNFNSGHIRSIRRHYLNRYGKRILTCKECNFFTGTRKTMDMHIKMGHSTCQSEPTHQKDLRCPFCLYQTKNKNNMIDHIDLHREERVVPIEVRRPKLSRYLQDIIFRCHKCTFTSGSAENLRLHLIRHNDVKPYKCRLCYFDCPRLSDLEAHLSDKHQVLRNHELVGQVSLDQLEERVDRMAGEEEEQPLCNHNNDNEEVNERGSVNDCHEVPHETQAKNQGDNSIIERITLHIKEANPKQGQDGKIVHEEIAAKSPESHLQYENTKANTTVQEKQDPVTVTEDVVEQTVEEGNNADIEMADCNFSEKHSHTNEDQPKRREDAGITLALQKEGPAEGSSTTHGRMAEKAQTHTLHIKALQQRMINIKVRAEDDKLPCDPLVEDDDIGKDRTVQMKTMLSEEAHNLKNKVNTEATSKKNHVQQINIKPLNSFTVERHLLRLTPNSAILKLSHNKGFGVSFAKFREEQAKRKGEKVRVTCGGMPEREKECLREERPPIGCPKEKDQNDHVEQKQVKDDENQHAKHKDADGIKETDNPHVPKAIIGGAAEVLCPSATEEKLFTCEFCGRNLTNSTELERHVMRHGI